MFARLRAYRRNRILRLHPIDDGLWSTVVHELPVLYGLDANDLARLRELSTLFVHDKTFFGTHGLVVSDYMRVIIAAQACLPILNLGFEAYRGWHTVILYPETFVARHQYEDDDGIVHEGVGELDGESVEGGPVVLSWAEASPRPPGQRDGTNVVVHEFAHKLDYLGGATNGQPPLHPEMTAENWTKAFGQAFADFSEIADADADDAPFDDYAAEDPGEFFAVMSEYFFEDPERVNDFFPDVYTQLRLFYKQDPLKRL